MNTRDFYVVVYQGAAGEPYQIGKGFKLALDQGSTQVDIVCHENDRVAAFAKAHSLAAGHDVFFTRRGEPGYLQDFYNYKRCPRCGVFIDGVEITRFAMFEEGRELAPLESKR